MAPKYSAENTMAFVLSTFGPVLKLACLTKARAIAGSVVGTRDLVSIQIRRLEPILDLTDASVYRATALAAGEQPDASLMTTDDDAAYEHCRRLSEAARDRGCTALIVPSAAQPGEQNLVIYFDVVVPRQVDIDDGPDRETIAFSA